MLSKKFLAVLIIIFIIIVAAVAWLAMKFLGEKDPAVESEYSAVYMISGDIYYGKLSWFPRPKLKEVWFLQRGVDQQSQQPQFGLAKFTTAFWGPVDELHLNADQILFWTKLRNDSQVVQAFKNPSALQQPAQQQPPPPSTFDGPSGPPPSSSQ